MRNYWCITDFEERLIILRVGIQLENKDTHSNDYIIDTKNFEESRDLWEKFNDFQFSEIPKTRRDLLERLSV